MKKHINSATEQYQDEYTDNWVLDDSPTKGSYNGVTSDGVATAIEQGGGSSYEAGDGISIQDDEISVKVDNSTVTFNDDGELQASTGTTYTAGNMISLANDAIAVSTTADITDIQQVAALPAEPVSTVIYLIPET